LRDTPPVLRDTRSDGTTRPVHRLRKITTKSGDSAKLEEAEEALR
jgi:hypothetical protein